MTWKLSFYTSHHQFYLCDKKSTHNTGDTDFWTQEALVSRLAVGNGILGIGTECYGPVRAELLFLDTKNEDETFTDYDHIVEAGVEIHSGILQVLDCPHSHIELEVPVEPGQYRVRIYSMNLKSVVGDSGDDFYRIEIWQDTDMKRTVLKQF